MCSTIFDASSLDGLLALHLLNKHFTLFVKTHEDAQTILGVPLGIKLLRPLDLVNGALGTVQEIEVHQCDPGNQLTVHLVLYLLRELEAEGHVQWVVKGLHHARHHHAAWRLHNLRGLGHAWVAHHHLLL